MKKIIIFALVIMVVLIPLFAQSVVEKSENEKVHLTFVEVMTNENRTYILRQAIANYEAQHPNIEIELISPAENEAEETLKTMLENGESVDICEIRDQSVAKLLDEDLLAPIDDYLANSDLGDRMLDAAFTATATFSGAGHYYFIMQYMYVKALLARADILEEYGIKSPTTMQELYEACVKLNQAGDGHYGFGIKGTNPCRILDLMFLGEIENINPKNIYTTTDGAFYLDTEAGRTALSNYIELYKNGSAPDSVNWSFYDQVEGFISGECAFIIQDPDALAMALEVLEDDQITVVPVPVGSTGKRYLDYGFAGLAIGATSQHKDEAFDFIRYMLSPSINTQLCEFYGALPVVKEVYELSPMFSNDHYKVGLDSLTDENTVLCSFPLGDPRFRDYMSLYTTAMQDLLKGNKTVDETVQTLKEFWTSN